MNILDKMVDNNNKTVKILNEEGSKQMMKYLSIGIFCHILNAYETTPNVNLIKFDFKDMEKFTNLTFNHLGKVKFGEIINDYGIGNNEKCNILVENENDIYNLGIMNFNTNICGDRILFFEDISLKQRVGMESTRNLCNWVVNSVWDNYITTEIEKTFNELYGEEMPYSIDIYKNLTKDIDIKNIEKIVNNLEATNVKDFKIKVFEYYNDKYDNELCEFRGNNFNEVITKFMGDNVYDEIINKKLKDSVLSYIELKQKLPTKIENIIEEQLNNNLKKGIMKRISQGGYIVGSILKDTNEKIKDDKEFILKIVKINGKVLEFVSDRLKNDKEVVLEAIKENRETLKYASEGLKKMVAEKGIESLQQSTSKWSNKDKNCENER